jgi:hypothetical protein
MAADFLRFLPRDDIMQLMVKDAGAVTPDLCFKPVWFNTNSDTSITIGRRYIQFSGTSISTHLRGNPRAQWLLDNYCK